jgi:hypothetical protein
MLQTFTASEPAAVLAGLAASLSADLGRAASALAANRAALSAALADAEAADSALDALPGASVLRRFVPPIVERMVSSFEQEPIFGEVRDTSASALRSEIERARGSLEAALEDDDAVEAVIEAARAEAAVMILRADVRGWEDAVLDAEDALSEAAEEEVGSR